MPHTAACWRWSASWLTANGLAGRQRPGSTSPTDTVHTVCSHSRHNPAKSCHCELPLMSQHQSPDYPKSDVTRNHNEGLNYLSYLFTNWNWNLMNFKNMLLGEKVILLSWCIWICTCKLCLQQVYLLLKLLGDWVCALCACPENSVLHISRFGVWLPLILFVVGFKQICRLHVLLFY